MQNLKLTIRGYHLIIDLIPNEVANDASCPFDSICEARVSNKFAKPSRAGCLNATRSSGPTTDFLSEDGEDNNIK